VLLVVLWYCWWCWGVASGVGVLLVVWGISGGIGVLLVVLLVVLRVISFTVLLVVLGCC